MSRHIVFAYVWGWLFGWSLWRALDIALAFPLDLIVAGAIPIVTSKASAYVMLILWERRYPPSEDS